MLFTVNGTHTHTHHKNIRLVASTAKSILVIIAANKYPAANTFLNRNIDELFLDI